MDINTNKHICFFIGDIANTGGTEKMTSSLANELVSLGYEVSIISISCFERTFFKIDDRINIYSILDKNSSFLKNAPQIISSLTRYTKEKSIDILVDVDVILSLFSLPVKLFNKALKIVSWEHFNYKTNLGISRRDYARKLSKKFADAIVTLTEQDRFFYLEDGKSKAKVCIINNFLENHPSIFATLDAKKAVAVGRFTHQKGFDILVDIWNIVKKNTATTDWVLQIIGDGEDKEFIKNKVRSLKLSSSIEIIDAKSNIGDYYLGSSIYLMTSRYEGLPMVLLEAQSYGLPIISFDCLTGPRELIAEGENGYLIPVGDNDLMAEKICSLITNDDRRKTFGQESVCRSQEYTKDKIVQKWIELFNCL